MFASFRKLCSECCGTLQYVGYRLDSSKIRVSRLFFECSERAEITTSSLVTLVRRSECVAWIKLAIVSGASLQLSTSEPWN